LSNNVAVGDANNKSVFVSVVFVLVLSDQSLTGIVVGLTLSSSSVFNLEALEVSLVLNNLNEWLIIIIIN
jgi:cytochrome b subunit of formate dehydrogenase